MPGAMAPGGREATRKGRYVSERGVDGDVGVNADVGVDVDVVVCGCRCRCRCICRCMCT